MGIYSHPEMNPTVNPLPPGFLARPKVRILKSYEGDVEGVLVQFRAPGIKGIRSVSVNEDVLLSMLVDGRNRPVILLLMEPVSGLELVKVVKGILRQVGTWKDCTRAQAQEIASLVLRGLFLGLEKKIPVPRPPAMAATVPA